MNEFLRGNLTDLKERQAEYLKKQYDAYVEAKQLILDPITNKPKYSTDSELLEVLEEAMEVVKDTDLHLTSQVKAAIDDAQETVDRFIM
jgi:hypothetical protein